MGTAVLIGIIFQAAWRPERMEDKDGTETRWLFWICANWSCGKTDRGVVWATVKLAKLNRIWRSPSSLGNATYRPEAQ